MEEPPRTQPEFSPGERLARIEAIVLELQAQMERRFPDQEKLFDQKLWGLGERLAAISNAQKEAVGKSEEATQRNLQAITEGIERSRKENSEGQDRYRREVAKRLEQLERGESAGRGAAELKNSTIAWIGALAALALAALYVIHP